MYAVEFKNVSKIYNLKLKNKKKDRERKKFYALKDISFKVNQGEVVGILGTNGSGKSTLSSIISGILSVDSGEVNINGEQALIAINTGLSNQLTGLENIKAKGALLGLSKKRINEIIDGVIEFAELGDFLYQPVKNYSSGMKSRLGFSISIYLNPDIIIIDEALSVGDSGFSSKCVKKIQEFKNEGKTIFFVSHSLQQVKSICNKALWIEGGELKEYGDIDIISKKYSDYVEAYKKKSKEDKKKHSEEIFNKRTLSLEKKSKKNWLCNKRKKLMLLSILAIIFMFSIFNNDTTERFVTSNKLYKDYNFTFIVEGKKIKNYYDNYRVYTKKSDENSLDYIVNLVFKQDGTIEISNIPIGLQVFYENFKFYDELKFSNINQDLNFIKDNIYKVINSDTNIFVIRSEDLNEFLNILNIDVKRYLPLEKSNFKIIEDIFYSLKNINQEKRLSIIKQLSKHSEKNNTDELIHVLNSLLLNDIKFTNKVYDLKEITIKEVLKIEEKDFLIDKKILNKKVIYLKDIDLNKNIYVKKIKEIIKNSDNVNKVYRDNLEDENNNLLDVNSWEVSDLYNKPEKKPSNNLGQNTESKPKGEQVTKPDDKPNNNNNNQSIDNNTKPAEKPNTKPEEEDNTKPEENPNINPGKDDVNKPEEKPNKPEGDLDNKLE